MSIDLKSKISLDGQAQFKQEIREIATQQKALRSEMNLLTAQFKNAGDAVTTAQGKVENLTKQIEEQRKIVARTEEQYEAFRQEQGENSASAIEMKTQLNNSRAALEKMESRLKDAKKELADASDKAKQLAQKLKDAGEKAIQMGDQMSKVGGNLTRHITLPLLAAGAAAVKAAIDYEKAFTGVTKTVDATQEEYEALSDNILEMSTRLSGSAVDIAEVTEAAGQLGIAYEDLSNFTEVMMNLGVSTNLSATEAAENLAKFANIVNMSSEDYERLGSVIVGLGNKFATTEADIVSMAMRLASAGNTVGLTEAQIMAIATALNSVGIEAEAGGGSMSKLLKEIEVAAKTYNTANTYISKTGMSLRELELLASEDSKAFKGIASSLSLTTGELKQYMNNAKTLENFSKVAGVTANEFISAWGQDAVLALDKFIMGLNDTERNGKNAVEILSEMGITEIRQSNAVLALANSKGILTEAINEANTAWEENIALTEEARKFNETTAVQLENMWDELKNTGIDLAKDALPAIKDIAKYVGELAEKFSKLSPETKEAIIKTLAFTAAVGPAIKVTGELVSGIGKLSTGIGKAMPQLTNIATKLGFGSVGSFAGAAGLAAGALVLLIDQIAKADEAYDAFFNGSGAAKEAMDVFKVAVESWDKDLEKAKSRLKEFNVEAGMTPDKMISLATEMQRIQDEINKIAETASRERRAYTDEEIERLEELFEKMDLLTKEAINMQITSFDVMSTKIGMEKSFDANTAQSYIKTAQDALEEFNSSAEIAYTETLARAAKVHGVYSKEYYEAAETARKAYEENLETGKRKYNEVYTNIIRHYEDLNLKENDFLIAMDGYIQAREDLQDEYIEETNKDYKYNIEDTDSWLTKIWKIWSDNGAVIEWEQSHQIDNTRNWSAELTGIEDEYLGNLDKNQIEQLAIWLKMVTDYEENGGKISESTRLMKEAIIAYLQELPPGATENMGGVFDGIDLTIENREPSVLSRFGQFVKRMINTLTGGEGWDAHSPSRKAIQIIRDVFKGFDISILENEGRTSGLMRQAAQNMAKSFEDGAYLDLLRLEAEAEQTAKAINAKMHAASGFANNLGSAKYAGVSSNIRYGDTITRYSYFEGGSLLSPNTIIVRNDRDIREIEKLLEQERLRFNMGRGKVPAVGKGKTTR